MPDLSPRTMSRNSLEILTAMAVGRHRNAAGMAPDAREWLLAAVRHIGAVEAENKALTQTILAYMQKGDILADAARLCAWLDDKNGRSDHEASMRVMKIGEEFGEAVQAYIGMTGQNPRKGVTHSRDDLTAELFDVAMTALVAIHHFTQDIDATRSVYMEKMRVIRERISTPAD